MRCSVNPKYNIKGLVLQEGVTLERKGWELGGQISGGLLTGEDGSYAMKLRQLSWINVPDVLKVQGGTTETVRRLRNHPFQRRYHVRI